MNYRAVWRPLALVLVLVGLALIAPLVMALFEPQEQYATRLGFAVAMLTCLLGAAGLWFAGVHNPQLLHRKEGMLAVALAWTLAGLLGAIPYVVSGSIPAVVDAIFESVSGFTTTGASIMSNLESYPRSIILWRSLSHWLGGAGVVVLFVAVLPMLGISGKLLYQVETSGPSKTSLHPRISDTARSIWLIYVCMTIVCIALLRISGLSMFEAVDHGFSAMSTGGYSSRSDSVGSFSSLVHGVLILFMFLGATNFALFYQAVRGKWIFLRDPEFRFYSLLALIGTLMVVGTLQLQNPGLGSLGQNLQDGMFGVVAMLTSTGFASADYELWHPLAQGVIFLCLLIGGSAGSTSGGIKAIRVLITLRLIWRYMIRLFRPQAVMPLRIGGHALSREVEDNVMGFVLLYMAWLVVGTLVLLAGGHDLLTSLTASIACQGCMGPAFGTVGPLENYADIYPLGKAVLSLQMIAGRLELMAISVLIVPSFWRR